MRDSFDSFSQQIIDQLLRLREGKGGAQHTQFVNNKTKIWNLVYLPFTTTQFQNRHSRM